MKLELNGQEIEYLTSQSRQSDARKSHKVVRSSLSPREVPAIVFIAMQPGAYTAPHMHPAGNQESQVLRGRIKSFFFDDAGKILNSRFTGKGESVTYPKGVYHTAIATEADTLVRELFWGIFDKDSYRIYPDWAVPESADAQPIRDYMARLI